MTTKILSFLLMLLLAQCDRCKEEVKPVSELDKLPPATKQGKFTFGCLINGKAFSETNSGNMIAIYQQGFLFFGVDKNSQGYTIGMDISIPDPIELNKKYDLTQIPYYRARFRKYLAGSSSNSPICYYDFANTLSGQVIITRFDRQKFIVSGTFEYTTALPNCDTIRITDGRFDLQYIP